MNDRLNELERRRGDLKHQGRFREVIPLQLEILKQLEVTDGIYQRANAWNYLSMLYHRVRDYPSAEHAARKALDVYAAELDPNAEVKACYQFMLAKILAAQEKFDEAIEYGEAGLLNYAVFHDPPDEFLRARQEDVERMREWRDRLGA
jgi:tetratricopeptide (TPR) repeat protein